MTGAEFDAAALKFIADHGLYILTSLCIGYAMGVRLRRSELEANNRIERLIGEIMPYAEEIRAKRARECRDPAR